MADSFKLKSYLAEPTNATGTYYPVSVLAVSIMAAVDAEPSIGDLYHIGVVESISLNQNRDTQEIRQIEAYPNVIMGKYKTPHDYNFGFNLGIDTNKESFFPGEPVFIVPGGIREMELSLKRVDFVNSLALEALTWLKNSSGETVTSYENVPDENYAPISNIADFGRVIYLLLQRRPFSIFEFIFNPAVGKAGDLVDSSSGKPGGVGIAYQDGWITQTSHSLSLGGAGNITTTPELRVKITRIRPFQFYTKLE